MNLVSGGVGDLILTGNPTQSFFKTSYSKYTPFGVQMFRIEYQGTRSLSDNSPTTLKFKIPRYADLLYDAYLTINIPDIYSDYRCPICANIANSEGDVSSIPCCCTGNPSGSPQAARQDYEFAWVESLGHNLIKDITLSIGGSVISKIEGEWLSILKVLGRTGTDSTLIDQMIGNLPSYTTPEESACGVYPTVPRPESRPKGQYPSI